jgi:hypothetical protein
MKTKNKSWYCNFEDEIAKLESLIDEMKKKNLLIKNELFIIFLSSTKFHLKKQ